MTSSSIKDPGPSPVQERQVVAGLERKVARLEEEMERLHHQNADLTATLEQIFSSNSWRLISLLQKTKAALKACWPPLRFGRGKVVLNPQRGVQKAGSTNGSAEEFLLGGGQAQFEALWTPAGTNLSETEERRCPTGWCVASGRVSGDFSHLYASLYWDTGTGFQGEQRTVLAFEDSRTQKFLIKLPSEVQRLRLDPFEAEGRVSFDDFTISELGPLQVGGVLFRSHILPLIGKPAQLTRRIKKAVMLFRNGGFAALRIRLFNDELASNYGEWVRRFDTLTPEDHERALEVAQSWESEGGVTPPTFSVVMPVYNPPVEFLKKAIESVQSQWYPHWELCIADDASTDPEVQEVLKEAVVADPRIKVTYRAENGHISAASNDALALASNEYVALLDHDDELRPHALWVMAERITREPGVELLYSDEDKITAHGAVFNPYFKPDWNPVFLLSQNYVCHFTVIRRNMLEAVGGFRVGLEGAQDWDLVLRVADAVESSQIAHIPHVLYHWRVFEGSTAQSTEAKPYVLEAQKQAVTDHLHRRGLEQAEVTIRRDISQLRIQLPLPSSPPLVSLIIPTRDRLPLLKQCVDSLIARTTYPNYEILIVDNGSVEEETLQYFSSIVESDSRVSVLRDEGEFNFSRLNNLAATHAKGELLGLLNNDLEIVDGEWLAEMVSYALLPENGAVGARLYYPNDLLQHGGVILGIGGVAGHSHKGAMKSDPGQFNRVILPQNLSAVTAACLVIRKSVYEQVGGLDEGALKVAFNDVDFCLRVREAGYRNVYTPYATLYHHESASRGTETTATKFKRFECEIETMKQRWGVALELDPYYNPNLTHITEDFAYGFPPRVEYAFRSVSADSRTEEQSEAGPVINEKAA